MQIIKDYIAPGRRNRPSTNPSSSRYKKIIPPKYITIHNAWSPWDAKGLNSLSKGNNILIARRVTKIKEGKRL